jgi:hypothetical protein
VQRVVEIEQPDGRGRLGHWSGKSEREFELYRPGRVLAAFDPDIVA